MKLEYRVVKDDTLLDTVTIEGTNISYATGEARDVVNGRIELFGLRQGLQRLKNWSNGYVRLREVPAPQGNRR